jgi:hypothetical protein
MKNLFVMQIMYRGKSTLMEKVEREEKTVRMTLSTFTDLTLEMSD